MLVPFLNCKLRNDGNTRVNLTIPPQELALLANMKGESAITEIEPSGISREMDPQDEYTRLNRKYGMDGETKRSYVEMSFGNFNEGRLATIMENGAAHYAPELSEAPPKKKRKRPSRSKAAVAARAADNEHGQDAAAA